MDVVVTGRHCEVSDRFRSHVDDKLRRLEKLDHRIIHVRGGGREGNATPARPTAPSAWSSPPSPRARSSGPRPRPTTDGARWTWPWTRWRRRCAGPPTAGATTGHTTPGVGGGLAAAEQTAGPTPGRREATDERSARSPSPATARGRAREDPRGRPDDPRPGPLRDGAGRPRLLPVRRHGERAAVRRLPATGLRLRRDLARSSRLAGCGRVDPRGQPSCPTGQGLACKRPPERAPASPACHDAACRTQMSARRAPRADPGPGRGRPGPVPAGPDDVARRGGGASRSSARPVTVEGRRWPRARRPTWCCSTSGCRGAFGHRGLPRHQGGGAVREDRHADDLRRGSRPLRGDQGRSLRLPAQGDLHRRGRAGGAGRLRRPVADQPVNGGQAASPSSRRWRDPSGSSARRRG